MRHNLTCSPKITGKSTNYILMKIFKMILLILGLTFLCSYGVFKVYKEKGSVIDHNYLKRDDIKYYHLFLPYEYYEYNAPRDLDYFLIPYIMSDLENIKPKVLTKTIFLFFGSTILVLLLHLRTRKSNDFESTEKNKNLILTKSEKDRLNHLIEKSKSEEGLTEEEVSEKMDLSE